MEMTCEAAERKEDDRRGRRRAAATEQQLPENENGISVEGNGRTSEAMPTVFLQEFVPSKEISVEDDDNERKNDSE